jgi:hypothetical protein
MHDIMSLFCIAVLSATGLELVRAEYFIRANKAYEAIDHPYSVLRWLCLGRLHQFVWVHQRQDSRTLEKYPRGRGRAWSGSLLCSGRHRSGCGRAGAAFHTLRLNLYRGDLWLCSTAARKEMKERERLAEKTFLFGSMVLEI